MVAALRRATGGVSRWFWIVYWVVAFGSLYFTEGVFAAMVVFAVLYTLAFGMTGGWGRLPSPYAVVGATAFLAYFALGWTQGNKAVDEYRLSEPLNWPLAFQLFSETPGVGEGECAKPDVMPRGESFDPGDGSRYEAITPDEANRMNEAARACIAQARRDGRASTNDNANRIAILLLGTTAGLILLRLPRALR